MAAPTTSPGRARLPIPASTYDLAVGYDFVETSRHPVKRRAYLFQGLMDARMPKSSLMKRRSKSWASKTLLGKWYIYGAETEKSLA